MKDLGHGSLRRNETTNKQTQDSLKAFNTGSDH